MIKIQEPIKLKSINNSIKLNQAFDNRILANYDFMMSKIKKEELLHLLIDKPEDEESSSITTLIENVSVENYNDIMINSINQLINRILINHNESVKYQDRVYIACILRKFGITNVSEFVNNIKNNKEKIEQTDNLLKLYSQTFNLNDKSIVNNQNTKDLSKTEKNLYEIILKRINYSKDTSTVYSFNHKYNQSSDKFISKNELNLAERVYCSKSVELQNKRREIAGVSSGLYLNINNPFEMNQSIDNNIQITKESIIEDLLKAAVFHIMKAVSVNVNETEENSNKIWIDVGYEICNTIKDSITRYKINHENNSGNTFFEIEDNKLSSQISNNEINVLKKINSFRKISKEYYKNANILNENDEFETEEKNEYNNANMLEDLRKIIQLQSINNFLTNKNYTNSKENIYDEVINVMGDKYIDKYLKLIKKNEEENKNILFFDNMLQNIDNEENRKLVKEINSLTYGNREIYQNMANIFANEYVNQITKNNLSSVQSEKKDKNEEIIDITKSILYYYEINSSRQNTNINKDYFTDTVSSTFSEDNFNNSNLKNINGTEENIVNLNKILSNIQETYRNEIVSRIKDLAVKYENIIENIANMFIYKNANVDNYNTKSAKLMISLNNSYIDTKKTIENIIFNYDELNSKYVSEIYRSYFDMNTNNDKSIINSEKIFENKNVILLKQVIDKINFDDKQEIVQDINRLTAKDENIYLKIAEEFAEEYFNESDIINNADNESEITNKDIRVNVDNYDSEPVSNNFSIENETYAMEVIERLINKYENKYEVKPDKKSINNEEINIAKEINLWKKTTSNKNITKNSEAIILNEVINNISDERKEKIVHNINRLIAKDKNIYLKIAEEFTEQFNSKELIKNETINENNQIRTDEYIDTEKNISEYKSDATLIQNETYASEILKKVINKFKDISDKNIYNDIDELEENQNSKLMSFYNNKNDVNVYKETDNYSSEQNDSFDNSSYITYIKNDEPAELLEQIFNKYESSYTQNNLAKTTNNLQNEVEISKQKDKNIMQNIYLNETIAENENTVILNEALNKIKSDKRINLIQNINRLTAKDEKIFIKIAEEFVNKYGSAEKLISNENVEKKNFIKENSKSNNIENSNMATLNQNNETYTLRILEAILKKYDDLYQKNIINEYYKNDNNIFEQEFLKISNVFNIEDETNVKDTLLKNTFRSMPQTNILYRYSDNTENDSESYNSIEKKNIKNYSESNNNRENVNHENIVINNKVDTNSNQIINNSSIEIQSVIKDNIQKEIKNITEQVYTKIERKLQSERKRRGI